MSTLTRSEKTGRTLDQQRAMWLALNRGVLARIASGLGLSRPFITDIFRGRRNNAAVESELTRLGAPGFKRSAENA